MSRYYPHNSSKIDNDSLTNLADEIIETVGSCRLLISGDQGNIAKNRVPKDENTDTIDKGVTLEKVAVDMSSILTTLKQNLDVFKFKYDSFSDVEPELKKLCEERKMQKESNEQQEKKPHTPVSNTNKPKSANNNNKKPPNKNVVTKNVERSNVVNNSKSQKNQQSVVVNYSSTQQKSKQQFNKPQQQQKQQPQKPNPQQKPNITRSSSPPLSNRESYDPLAILKQEVKRAVAEKKVFTIKGRFPEIRRSLLKRGWVEKLHPSSRNHYSTELAHLHTFSIPELLKLVRNDEVSAKCKNIIKTKLLEDHQPDLYWSHNYEPYKEITDKVKVTKINKIRRKDFSFTSKKGISDAAKKAFVIPESGMNHPRTYSLIQNGDTKEFVDDFNLTAAMSLLKWVHQTSITMESKIISPTGKIPTAIFDFAVTECYRFLKKVENKDIVFDIPEAFESEWNNFLDHFYKLVHVSNHFKLTDDTNESDMVRKSVYLLDRLREVWPFLDMDGLMNIWILKPVNSSQGVGIHMCRTLRYVLNVVKNNPNRRYVIQKYIERPLLIYNTKFDIRQWFLIGSTVPLTIWMYKSCYLRFSSQTYNLRKLHESIHLTNNSVQCKYSKSPSRDVNLPTYNMWDSDQFKAYLSNIGYANVFSEVVHPGMRQCIVSTVLLHQKKLERRRNTFELYGADFIITEDFKPWLLEINASPALHASTPVTARMCPAVLEDVIKVVVDLENNPRASTGDFQLVYKGTTPIPFQIEPFLPDLSANVDMPKPWLYTFNYNKKDNPVICIKRIGMGMKKTLENILTLLKKERARREENKTRNMLTSTSFWNKAERSISIETIPSIANVDTQTALDIDDSGKEKEKKMEGLMEAIIN